MEEQRMTAEELLKKIAQVVAENFVAIYEKQDNGFLIRSVGGQVFRLMVEEV